VEKKMSWIIWLLLFFLALAIIGFIIAINDARKKEDVMMDLTNEALRKLRR
jgi:uncharacterized protein YneF (UPF0154 family)